MLSSILMLRLVVLSPQLAPALQRSAMQKSHQSITVGAVYMRLDFVVVDLLSQLDAVNHHVRGWLPLTTLSWLKWYGQVEEVTYSRVFTYTFRSVCGLETPFSFDEGGQIQVPGHWWRLRIDQDHNPRLL